MQKLYSYELLFYEKRYMKRIWIVGASSGIGFELVKIWLLKGSQVVCSSRNASRTIELVKLKEIHGENLHILDMDVGSLESVKNAVPNAWKYFGGIDLWFYNAGVYEVMPIENWNVAHFEDMMQVNYMGTVRVMSEIMPYFKEQKSGRWVWNSSLSSYFGLPLGGGYSASKAALCNLAEALQPELEKYGVELQIINHGFVKTRLTQKNSFNMPELMDPIDAAKRIAKEIDKSYHFEIHFPFKISMFLALLRLFPYRLSLFLTKKMTP